MYTTLVRRPGGWLPVFLVLAAMLTGCGGGGEKAETRHNHAADGTEATHGETDMSAASEEDVRWPDDVPGIVPPFCYGTVAHVDRAPAAAGGAGRLGLHITNVTEAAGDPVEQYAGDLERAGWTVEKVSEESRGVVTGPMENLSVNFTYDRAAHTGTIDILPAAAGGR